MTETQYSKKFMSKLTVFLAFLFVSTLFLNRYGIRESSAIGSGLPVAETATRYTVVLDAGHGGEDGGAVGVNGALEKDLNLALAKKMQTLLTERGYRAILTRSEDRLLYTDEQNVYGQRKAYDLKNRLAIAEREENAILVSIHMNRFTLPQYSGLQVYYSKNHPSSAQLAKRIQEDAVRTLQPNNKRQVKAADSSIYLLNHATVPAVLVECGFLSNPDECARLSDEAYRNELAQVMTESLIAHMEMLSAESSGE